MTRKQRGKETPYSRVELAQELCAIPKCDQPAATVWGVCIIPRWYPICFEHDVALNRHFIEMLGLSRINKRIAEYMARPPESSVLKPPSNDRVLDAAKAFPR